MTFDELQLVEPLLRAVRAEGYEQPTPIQVQAIPHILAGRDLLGCAQTGTGKTAAFALPILQRLMAQRPKTRDIRVLVLSPTRELTSQIGDSFDTYGQFTPIREITIFGGVNQNRQIDNLRRGADVLVATPGRLLDLMSQGYVHLERVEILVLDEADRMLDMGFIHDVRKIISVLPTKRQTLLFSATMPADIQALADSVLNDPVNVAVTPIASTVDTIEQSVFFVEKGDKPALLQHLLRDTSMKRVLVFTRTKHGANKVVQQLEQSAVQAEAIHGNKSQSAREAALSNFKSGRIRVLVATDIAARGIDVDNITHVINYDLPNEPESYVHRIGRTARAGAAGIAYSFCNIEERSYLRDIERLIRRQISVTADHPYESRINMMPTEQQVRDSRRQNQPQSQRQPQSNAQPRSQNGNSQGNSRRRPNNRRRSSSESYGDRDGVRSNDSYGRKQRAG